MLEPDARHRFCVQRPKKLHLMAFQSGCEIAETAAEDGLVKLGGSKTLGDVETTKHCECEGSSERFHLEACHAQDWQEGRGSRARAKGW